MYWNLLNSTEGIIYFHFCLFQVFHLHILLGVQNLLCVWVYAPGIPDIGGGYSVCLSCQLY